MSAEGLEEIQRVNEGLCREVETLRSLVGEEEQEHSRQLQALRAEMRELGAKHRRDITQANSQYKVSSALLYGLACRLLLSTKMCTFCLVLVK